MTVYYVRPDGNNLNDGLGPGADHAWATNSKAAATMVTGDKAITGPGTYRELIQPVATGVEFFGDFFAANFPGVVPGKVRITGLDSDASAAPVRYNAFKITTDNVKISGLWYLDGFLSGATVADQAAIYISGKFPWVSGATIRGAAKYGVYFGNITWTGSYAYDQTIFERLDIESVDVCIFQPNAAYSAGVTIKDCRLVSTVKHCVAVNSIAQKFLRNDCYGLYESTYGSIINIFSPGSSYTAFINRCLVLGNKVVGRSISGVAFAVSPYQGNVDGTAGAVVSGNVVEGIALLRFGVEGANNGTKLNVLDIHGNEVYNVAASSLVSDMAYANKLTAYLRRNRFFRCAQTGSFISSGTPTPNYAQEFTLENNEFLNVVTMATNLTSNYTMTWNGNRYALIGTGLVPADAGAVLGMPVELAPVAVPGIESASPISGGKSLKIPVWGTNLGGQFLRIPVNAGNNTIRLKAKKTFAGGSVTFEVNQGTQVAMADNTDVQTIEVSGYQAEAGYCELRIIAETADLAVNDTGADFLLLDDLEVV